MRSIERRFNRMALKNPGWSSYVCFAEAVMGQQFNKSRLRHQFNKLVEKDDYVPEEKNQTFNYLWKLNKEAEAHYI